MRVFVTGPNGFIGKELIIALSSKKYQVVNKLNDSYFDLTKWSTLNTLKNNIDMIIHLAAKTSDSESFITPRKYYSNNLLCTINALELARISSAKFVNMSSYFYGSPNYIPVDENHPLSPHNPYSNTKYLSEEICRGYANDYNMDIVSLRLFNIYGKGQKGNFLIPDILRQIDSGQVILNDPRPKRDYIHVSDVVAAINLFVEFGFSGYNIFNIGSGRSYSVKKIIDLILKNSPKKFSYSFKGEERKNEVLNSVADISKIKRLYNWEPKISIQEGIKSLF